MNEATHAAIRDEIDAQEQIYLDAGISRTRAMECAHTDWMEALYEAADIWSLEARIGLGPLTP